MLPRLRSSLVVRGPSLLRMSTRAPVDLHFQEQPAVGERDASLPPLVVFHGLLGSCSNFRVVNRFAPVVSGRRVILADVCNHGASPHVEEMPFEAMANDVVRLLDRINEPRCILLGHSLGM
jgi:pimeloyl-ACP methyl ester carboxylesterase